MKKNINMSKQDECNLCEKKIRIFNGKPVSITLKIKDYGSEWINVYCLKCAKKIHPSFIIKEIST